MLENPVVSRTTRVVRTDIYSDNVTGAENQQERLIEFRGWVIGFVDGEGCFSIGFVRQQDRPARTGQAGTEGIQDRLPGCSRVRGDTRRAERRLSPRVA